MVVANKAELIAEQLLTGSINKKQWGSAMYNVLVEGLAGGGVVDDTAKLQALVDKAIAEGRKAIFFPHGTNGQYRVTALTNADQVVFFGDNASFAGGYTGEILQLGEGGVTQAETVTQIYNVLGNGLVGGGVIDDTAALQTLVDTSIAAGRKAIYFPHGTNGQYKVTALTNADQVLFFGDNASFVGGYTGTINQIGDAQKFNGGVVSNQTQFNARTLFIAYNTTIPESTIQVSRNIIGAGGNFNQIGNGLNVSIDIAAEVKSAEWGITSVLNSYANAVAGGSAGNVSHVAQGNKYGTGPVWGSNIMARDMSGLAAGTEGLFGLELNITANEADPNDNRNALYITGVRQLNQGGLAEFSSAIKAIATVNTKFKNGLWMQGNITTGINLQSNGTTAIKSTGTNTYGLDLSGGTHAGAALRIKANEWIELEQSLPVRFKYNTTSGNIEFYYGGAIIGHIVAVGGADHAL